MKPGQRVGDRYKVVRLIGKGGMGAVYEVVNTRIRRSFALKRLDPTLTDDVEALARFKREAMVVASLRHPNIVDVVDWENLDDGSPCILLEYLRGEDLGERIRRAGALPWPMLGRISREILSALQVAHRAGIVHRDMKPHNVFLAVDDGGREHVKLLDFGLSKVRDARSVLSADDRLVGTPAYMSPEQANGKTGVGQEADVWAMGAILYEMATGQPAFTGSSVPAILYQIIHGDAAPVSAHRPDAPEAFSDVVARVLTNDPARRISEVSALRDALRLALDPVAPEPPEAQTEWTSGSAHSSPFAAQLQPSTLSRAAIETRNGPMSRTGGVVSGLLLVVVAVGIAIWVGVRGGAPEPAAETRPPAHRAAAGTPSAPAPAAAPVARVAAPDAAPVARVAAPDAAPVARVAEPASVARPGAGDTPGKRARPSRRRRKPSARRDPTPISADQIFGK